MIVNFSEKIFKLRKEQSFSQEALAEQLNTTRQAISKWENNQGFPETEKLLMMGNIFEVSIDYLLKDTIDSNREDENGYYVNKDMVEGYLMQERKMAKNVSLGVSLIILSFVPYFLLNLNPVINTILIIAFATIGTVTIISTFSTEKEKYKILKREPLLFDDKYLKELRGRYETIKKRNFVLMFLASILIVVGLLAFLLEKRGIVSGIIVPYYPTFIVMIAVGIYIFVRILPILEAYRLLVENEKYINKLSFKLKKKAIKKVDNF